MVDLANEDQLRLLNLDYVSIYLVDNEQLLEHDDHQLKFHRRNDFLRIEARQSMAKSIQLLPFITTILFMILCIQFSQGLQCYQHEICVGTNCNKPSMKNVTCKSDEDRCWKLQTPVGVQRGCSKGNCDAEIDFSAMNLANKCCSTDLCNTSNQIAISAVSISILGFIGILHRLYM